MNYDDDYLPRVDAALGLIPNDVRELIEAYGSAAIDWGYEIGAGPNGFARDPYENINAANAAYHKARLALLEKLAEGK